MLGLYRGPRRGWAGRYGRRHDDRRGRRTGGRGAGRRFRNGRGCGHQRRGRGRVAAAALGRWRAREQAGAQAPGPGLPAKCSRAAGTGGAPRRAARAPSPEWAPLTVMALEDPMDHGAVGDGVADDLDALGDGTPAGRRRHGVLPAGQSSKAEALVVTRSHVKFWAADRAGGDLPERRGQRRHQSILCRDNEGCGFFGLKLRSDATQRFDALEDHQISADHASLVEVTGCEIEGSAASGIMLFGSRDHYIDGNYIHHTWADHIHHTDGARESWVWNNFVFNEEPSRGDDGVACVTYGPGSARCADMEWWANTVLHTGWGRGYSVIGGDDISIHHNWAIGVAGAGIIVASEDGYNSASSDGIAIENNNVYQCGHSVGHPGILISGLNSAAEPLAHIALRDNVSADTVMAEAYRAEGEYTKSPTWAWPRPAPRCHNRSRAWPTSVWPTPQYCARAMSRTWPRTSDLVCTASTSGRRRPATGSAALRVRGERARTP